MSFEKAFSSGWSTVGSEPAHRGGWPSPSPFLSCSWGEASLVYVWPGAPAYYMYIRGPWAVGCSLFIHLIFVPVPACIRPEWYPMLILLFPDVRRGASSHSLRLLDPDRSPACT